MSEHVGVQSVSRTRGCAQVEGFGAHAASRVTMAFPFHTVSAENRFGGHSYAEKAGYIIEITVAKAVVPQEQSTVLGILSGLPS